MVERRARNQSMLCSVEKRLPVAPRSNSTLPKDIKLNNRPIIEGSFISFDENSKKMNEINVFKKKLAIVDRKARFRSNF